MPYRAKEKQDVDNMEEPSVKNYFLDPNLYNAQLSKEQVRLHK